MPDFTTYLPPDVYIEEERTALINIAGTAPSVVGIVGPSIGYRRASETVALTGVLTTRLQQLGIDLDSVVVRDASGATLSALTDYELVSVIGPDTVVDTPDDSTDIRRRAGSTIADGGTVYVSYNFADPSYAAPTKVRSYEEAASKFGQAIDLSTGVITSPLSLAAQIAFVNGANEIVLVSAGPDSDSVTPAQLATGLAALDAMNEVDLVVVLPVGITGTDLAPGDTATVADNLKAHLEEARLNRVTRFGFLGFDTNVSVALDGVAGDMAEDHMVLAYPNRMLYFNGYSNRDIEVGGMYLAAAYAGMAARLPPQEPLTNKAVRGLSGIPGTIFQTMTNTYKNVLSASGVAVTELTRDNPSRLVIRHGVTTDVSNTMGREFSLVRTKEALVSLIRDTLLRTGLIGSYIDDDAIANVKSVANGCLRAAENSDIIRGYQGLSVRQQEADPTVIEIKFQYDPLYPLNYIVVIFGISTTTGETAPVENTLAA